MTIRLGASSFNQVNDSLEISPPSGFNQANAIRMANYTADVLILQNITGTDNSDVQYLPPFTQMVYPISQVQDLPVFRGFQLGPDVPAEQVLIEWSDDGDNDFLGTYPYALPLNPDTVSSGNGAFTITYTHPSFLEWVGPVVAEAFSDGVLVPPLSSVLSMTLVNTSASAAISYSPDKASFESGILVTLPAGASLTIDNASGMYVGLDPSADDMAIFGTFAGT